MNVWTTACLAAGLGTLLVSVTPVSAQRTVIRPEGAPADRPYSPGVRVGQTLYISGQLGLPGSGATPATMDAQARQAMDGIGSVLKAAGLGYQHLVKCHVYLANMDDYAAMNAAYGSYFTDRVPARTTVQAAGLPAGAGVQIACIAFADVARISVVRPPQGSLPAPLGPYSPAVWAGDTLYVSGMGGQDPATKTVADPVEAQTTQTLANITTTLKAAGLGLQDVTWAQGYATRLAEAPALEATLAKGVDAPRGMLVLPRLPGPIRAELTMIAVKPTVAGSSFGAGRDAGSMASGRRRGATTYVDAVVGTGADFDAQCRHAFARLGSVLQASGGAMRDVALVTVYVSDIADMPKMNAIFKETFPTDPPARVTIQVQPQGAERIRIGLIAAQ